MKILVTGAAGFIGFHTCLKLVNQGHEVYGIDNINDYYDPKLKFDRLNELGFNEAESKLFKNEVQSAKFNSLRFSRIDLVDHESIDNLFKQEQFEVVCNLAAQAGVRYSIENPKAYIDSNISGFLNILEGCRNHKVKHLVYASSSSVYGENKKVPFETTDNVDHPISLYAATKKSNELMAIPMVIYMALKLRDYVFLQSMALGEDLIWLIIYLQKQSQITNLLKCLIMVKWSVILPT